MFAREGEQFFKNRKTVLTRREIGQRRINHGADGVRAHYCFQLREFATGPSAPTTRTSWYKEQGHVDLNYREAMSKRGVLVGRNSAPCNPLENMMNISDADTTKTA